MYAITPDPGYGIADVFLDGAALGPLTSLMLTGVQADHLIEADFAALGMPTSTVSGWRSNWSDRPVKLAFAGHPGASGAAIARTEYRLGDGAWVVGSRVTIRAQGTTVVEFRCQDEDGILEDPARTIKVRIDSRSPRVVARAVSARRGSPATVRYQVSDPRPSSGSALVRAVVVDAADRTITRASARPVTTDRWQRLHLSTARLWPGTYTVVLRAKDRAGNWQEHATRVPITVR